MQGTSGRTGGGLAGDMIKGAIAGAVGVWVMDRIGWAMYLHEDPEAFRQEKQAQVGGQYVAHVAAGRAAEFAGGRLSPQQQWRAGKSVHYAIGIMPGAAYGALRNHVEGLGAGRGLIYGLGLFLLMDEGVAPAMGWASGPTKYPWQAHARGLATHLALGAVTDAAFDVLDRLTMHNCCGSAEGRRH